MVNIVRAILGLNEDDGKEIAKAVKEVKKKEKKTKNNKKVKSGIERPVRKIPKRETPKPEPEEVEPDAE